LIKLTDHFLDEDWFVLPSNEDEVDRNTRGNDGQTHGCFYRGGDHGDHGDEDGGNDVDDGEDQLHLDRPVPLRVLPPQPGDAEHSLGRAKNDQVGFASLTRVFCHSMRSGKPKNTKRISER
jgi:hypothetical protein